MTLSTCMDKNLLIQIGLGLLVAVLGAAVKFLNDQLAKVTAERDELKG